MSAVPPSTLPPSAEPDPFGAARAASTRRLVRVGLVVGALVLIAGIVVGLLGGRGDLRLALPVGVVAQLRSTSLESRLDAQTGYQRLASLLPTGAELEAAALAEDGTLAIALDDGEHRLLVLRGGAVSATPLVGLRATVLAFTPDSELYVGFDDGRVSTLAPGALASALAPAALGAAPASTVIGFAFDRETKRTAVVFAGGEVFTALRPFRPDALHAVTIPPNARVRLATFTGDSELVLAGDRGQVFVSDGDAWDAVPLATSGTVVALATDLAGELIVAQSNGELFRRDGGWESLGQAPAPPVAIGELGALGVVAVLSDGRVVGVQESHDAPTSLAGYVPRGPASSGQIAGMNVLVLSRQRLVVAEPGEPATAWASDDPDAGAARDAPHDCRVFGAASHHGIAPPLPLLVCGDAPRLLGSVGLRDAPALPVSGRDLPAGELLSLLRAGRGATYVAGRLVRPSYGEEPPSLLEFRTPELRYLPLVTLPPEEGPLDGWSAALGEGGAVELVTISASGAVRFARVPQSAPRAIAMEPIAAQLVATRAAIDTLRAQDGLPRPVALGGGRVLLAYPGWPTLIARLDAAAPEQLEPVPVRPDPSGPIDDHGDYDPPLFAAAGAGWLARPFMLERIGASGDAVRIADAIMIDRSAGTLVTDARGRLHAVASRVRPGGVVVSVLLGCDASSCTERAFPAGVVPSRIFLAADGKLGVLERGGAIGLFAR